MKLAIVDATAGTETDSHQRRGGRYAAPLANRPLILHVMGELAGIGITRALIIASHDVRRELWRILGSGHLAGLELTYVDAPAADGGRTVLTQLERSLSHEPVLLHPGDALFGDQLIAIQQRFGVGDVDSVLPEQLSVAAPRAPDQRRVAEGVLALGPGTREIVADLRSPGGEGDDLIAGLLASECRLGVCAATDPWFYSDAPDVLLAGNRRLLDRLAGADPPGELADRNELHGRISVHPTAYVSDCIIAGPVLVGERAVLEGSFIGPYTAIGAGVVLRGAELDNSMVLEGAEIHHPGLRIESSIIGERARVTRSFQLPRGVHLDLGPGGRVEFS
jgi:glucose-1-phosphate thymidylyltransferase